ncbi:fec operon regulator FecR [compost metagenome]
MLDAGTDTAALDAAHESRAERSGHEGVLGQVLEVAPSQGVPLDVHPGTEQHAHPGGPGLGPERLADLLDELGRYRPGMVRCHDAVADLAVSGSFSLRDTDASLGLLQSTLPIKVSSLTRYWVTVEPR